MKKDRQQRDAAKQFDIKRSLPKSYIPENQRKRATQGLPETEPEKTTSSKKPKSRRKRIILSLIIIILLPVLIIGGWDARNVSRASQKMFGSGNLLSLLTPAELKNDEGRVNMLVVGFSADDKGHAGAELTDTIMVLSLDKRDKTGYMLSIPRDLYIDIPGFGYAKINEAYQDGKNSKFSEAGYPKGGMGLLEKTLSKKLAIDFNYYALVNFGAVKDTVAALGGVTVKIKSDDPRGIYDPNFKPEEGGALKLSNGVHTIDAKTALKLTRARGSTYGSYGLAQSDFDRTKNQRLVIKAIKEKMTWKLILDPRKNSKLFDAIANNVKTDLKLNTSFAMLRLFNSVPDNKLKSAGFRDDKNNVLLASYTTPTGQSALIPASGVDDYSQIKAYIKKLNN